jgi:energy-coupling factor transporter transmembrane protein EcfT
MKKLIYFISLIIIFTLSYLVVGFEFILFAISALSFIFLLILGVMRIFKKLNSRYLKIPLLIIGTCLLGVLVSLFRPYGEAIVKSGSVSEKLEYAYETDQKDRKQVKSFVDYFSLLVPKDTKRLQQVKDIYKEDVIVKPIDKFYSAFVYHHSNNSKDYEIASKLATEAAESDQLKDNYQVQWLRKAAYDRWMLSLGKPEKYNTQNSFSIEVE